MIDPDELIQAINSGIDKAFAEHTKIIWGKVEKVEEKTIDIQPSYKGTYNGKERSLPLLTKVPPIFLQGGTSYRADPITVGDYALIFIADRCIENWYNNEDNKVPRQYRIHDLSDAFAIVGINPLVKAITIPTVITEIGNKYKEGDCEHIGNIDHTGNYIQEGDYTQTGDYNLTGDITHEGDQNTTGSITATLNIQASNFSGLGGTAMKSTSNIETTGQLKGATINVGGQTGVSGTFTSQDGKTITVTQGIITSII